MHLNQQNSNYRQHCAQRNAPVFKLLKLRSVSKTLNWKFKVGKKVRITYSEADFEVFRPAAATRSPMAVKIGMEGGPRVPSCMPNFTPIGAMIRV